MANKKTKDYRFRTTCWLLLGLLPYIFFVFLDVLMVSPGEEAEKPYLLKPYPFQTSYLMKGCIGISTDCPSTDHFSHCEHPLLFTLFQLSENLAVVVSAALLVVTVFHLVVGVFRREKSLIVTGIKEVLLCLFAVFCSIQILLIGFAVTNVGVKGGGRVNCPQDYLFWFWCFFLLTVSMTTIIVGNRRAKKAEVFQKVQDQSS